MKVTRLFPSAFLGKGSATPDYFSAAIPTTYVPKKVLDKLSAMNTDEIVSLEIITNSTKNIE